MPDSVDHLALCSEHDWGFLMESDLVSVMAVDSELNWAGGKDWMNDPSHFAMMAGLMAASMACHWESE